MSLEANVLTVLKHDLHKLTPNAVPHKDALPDPLMKKADAKASWLSRNFLEEPFENKLYRKSLIFQVYNINVTRGLINKHRGEIGLLFNEEDPYKLHELMLHSELLGLYSEAREFPYSSLRYHVLFATALYYNFKQGNDIKDLYLCENLPVESPFQLILKDDKLEWSLQPRKGMARIYPQFWKSWERRTKPSLGGEYKILDGMLSSINSWSVSLASVTDFMEFIRKI